MPLQKLWRKENTVFSLTFSSSPSPSPSYRQNRRLAQVITHYCHRSIIVHHLYSSSNLLVIFLFAKNDALIFMSLCFLYIYMHRNMSTTKLLRCYKWYKTNVNTKHGMHVLYKKRFTWGSSTSPLF